MAMTISKSLEDIGILPLMPQLLKLNNSESLT